MATATYRGALRVRSVEQWQPQESSSTVTWRGNAWVVPPENAQRILHKVDSADNVHDNPTTNHMQHTLYAKFCDAKLRDLHEQGVR